MDSVRQSPAPSSGQERHPRPIPSLDSLLELDDLNPREKDQVFDCLLRLLTNPNVARLLESDSSAQGRFLKAVQTISCTTFLSPAATPSSVDWLSEGRTPSPERASHNTEPAIDIAEDEDDGMGSSPEHHVGSQGSPQKRNCSDGTSPSPLATEPVKKRRRPGRKHLVVPDFGQENFAVLPNALRAAIWKMKEEGTHNAWLSFHSRRDSYELRLVTASDPRPKQLRDFIENWIDMEKSLQGSALVYRVSKRVHLVELAAAKAAMQGKPEAVNERLTDLVFPELIVYKQATKNKGSNPYYQAKRKLEYWLRLGTPLLRFVERYGYAILLLLPDTLTDTVFHKMRREHIAPLVDYIGTCYPDLKEQLSGLSTHIPSIVEQGPPAQLLVLETFPSSEKLLLSSRSFGELFRFSDCFRLPGCNGRQPELSQAMLINGKPTLPEPQQQPIQDTLHHHSTP